MKFLKLFIGLSFTLSSYLSQAAFEIPHYEKYTLANGLTVYLMEQSEVPLVDVRLVVRAGAVNDEKQYGLANITGDALIFGAGKYSKNELEEQFDFVGANFRSYTNKETSAMSLSFAAKDQNSLMPIFANMVTQPQFKVNDFVKYKKRYLANLEQKRESPRSIIGDAFNRSYFVQHPYGNPVEGNFNSVNMITLAQIKQFYDDFYTPANSALIVVGDIDSKQWKQKITNLFASWQGNTKKQMLPAFQHTAKQSNVLIINKTDATETAFIIGGKGIAATNEDAVALSVINTILGGRFTSWLNDALRVNSGLTYGARSHFNSYSSQGNFYISTFTKNATTFEAIDLTLKTYQRLWNQGIDEKTLVSAKAYVKGQFPPKYETSTQLMNLLARMWSLGFNDSYINDFEKNVDALNVNSANKLAQHYFPHNNLQFVLIGKADLLRKKAKKYGEVTEQNIMNF